MRQTALAALILTMFAASVYAQPDEEISSPPDSLQNTESDSLPPEEIEVPIEVVSPTVVPDAPSDVLQVFFQSLRTGDTFMISQLISSDGLDEIEIMLEILQENLDDATMSRLSAAGYTATASEIDDWSSMDYLTSTIILPVMKARYSIYEMHIGDYSDSGNELTIPLVFSTSSGLELQFEAILKKENNQWKVTSFMGLNSFP
ncbi:MAG: hypothetical protein ABFR50_03450 [Candidatus Fermentibacteria bacterium]